MFRLLLFIIALVIAAIGLARIADTPGTVSILWMGWQIETSVMFLTFAVGVLVIGVFLLYRIVDSIVSLPDRFRRSRRADHHERGLSALTEAFAALAVSDHAAAKKLTRKADKLLGSPPITHLLAAQLARLEGDGASAVAHLRPLLQHKETRFLAARGLLEQARQSGDMKQAIAYAEEAENIRPDSSFAAISLIDLYTHEQRWQQALDIVRKARKHKALNAGEAKRYTALVEYQHALNLYAREEFDTALRYAKSAHKALPDMAPLALLLMRIHFRLGQKRQIPVVVARTWKLAPHPSLATLYKKQHMDEPPSRRLKRMEKLAAHNPNDIESHVAMAEAALDDGQFEKAHNHLKIALGKQETPRICKLMARLEETAHKDKVRAEEWTARAAKAAIGPSWTCESCKAAVERWSLHCPECDGFDTIEWKINRLNFLDSPKRIMPPENA